MAIDAGEAAVIAAAVGGMTGVAGGAIGSLLQHFLERRRAREDRLRAFRNAQLDEAERSMVLALDLLVALSRPMMASAKELATEQKKVRFSDSLLVGDKKAAQLWALAGAQALRHMPAHALATLHLGFVGLRLSPAEGARIREAKAKVQEAFDAQRERVMRDQKVERLDPSDLSDVKEQLDEIALAIARYEDRPSVWGTLRGRFRGLWVD